MRVLHATVTISFALALALSCIATAQSTSSPPRAAATRTTGTRIDEFGVSGDAPTLALLRTARRHIGLVASLRAVRSVRVEGVRIRGAGETNKNSFRHSIVFPDKFRSDNPTVSTVVSGASFWRIFHKPLPGYQESPEEAREIRKRTTRGFIETCLTLFLRAPEATTVAAAQRGTSSFGALSGRVVDFTVEGVTLHYVLDAATSQPLGVAVPGRLTGGAGPAVDSTRIERFTRHEVVAGLRVPVGSEDVVGANTATIQRTVFINEPVEPGTFAQPERRR